MKYVVSLVLAAVILSGCGAGATEMDRAICLRNALLQSRGCTFESVITADYGSKVYTFRMNCTLDENNTLTFVVLEPDTIAGISGKFASDGGKLIFDETVLAFPALTDGQLTPVTPPRTPTPPPPTPSPTPPPFSPPPPPPSSPPLPLCVH